LPRIRSERPAFDAAHPELADMDAPVRKNILDDAIGGPTLGKRN
jgi:hypothetical protein